MKPLCPNNHGCLQTHVGIITHVNLDSHAYVYTVEPICVQCGVSNIPAVLRTTDSVYKPSAVVGRTQTLADLIYTYGLK